MTCSAGSTLSAPFIRGGHCGRLNRKESRVSRDTVALVKHVASAFLVACALTGALILLAGSDVRATGRAAQAGQPPASQAPAAPAATPAPAGYVGTDTCLTCHDTQSLHTTPHGNPKIPGSPASLTGLRDVPRTGPGPRGRSGARPSAEVQQDAGLSLVSDTCLKCHTDSEHAMWQGSAHAARSLGCTTCHSVHSPVSAKGQLVKASVHRSLRDLPQVAGRQATAFLAHAGARRQDGAARRATIRTGRPTSSSFEWATT